MLLTITNTAAPATDLGYLLHKNPGAVRSVETSFGLAHVFYPEATEQRCTAALMIEVDPITLVRGHEGSSDGQSADSYVNDRPYVASSLLSVAIARVFGTALSGKSNDRPELAQTPLPLEAVLTALPCRGDRSLVRGLFAPLGYEITEEQHALDEAFPSWGEGPYLTVTLRAKVRLSELLAHLYVLVPVLDDDKHYWVDDSEIDKLLRRGEGWLAAHPERELIAKRALRHQRRLADEALARLDDAGAPSAERSDEANEAREERLEKALSLNEQRMNAVVDALRSEGAKSVLDLGCGEGRLLRDLLDEPQFERVTGMDVSHRALERAKERLQIDRMAPTKSARLTLAQGSLTYRDARLEGFDAAAIVEVIEHLDPDRLHSFERVIFEFARPKCVVLTTPNAEYNARFAALPAGRMRHPDHRFEWTRAEFLAWLAPVAARHGYSFETRPIGPEDPALGAPTQMAVLRRE